MKWHACFSVFQRSTILAFLGCLLGSNAYTAKTFAQTLAPKVFSVEISANVQSSPPAITLVWPGDGSASGYRVSRKTPNTDSWSYKADLGGGATSYTDLDVAVGNAYEYQVIKTAPNLKGYGYIYAGIQAPLIEYRGKIILLVENSLAGAVGGELARLQQDLAGDGWVVIRHDVSASDAPGNIKNLIKSDYYSDPGNVKGLFIFGHIPVVYSGNIIPDGHENHKGAWPADTFYGDMDGQWTDNSVNTTTAERQSNWNTPGDGKYDQSEIPSDIDLEVGRVDLSNMTCFSNKANSRSEVDLMRQYLNKDHNFRFGQLNVERRAIICDNFTDKGDDPIGGSAWRNFPGFFGNDQIQEVPWNGLLPAATSQTYLWAYGSGGGSYYYSTGVATSDDFATSDFKAVFTMFMGSYFGDWNNESNFLRAPLGSTSYTLTSSYSGFPHTIYIHMALGLNIGYSMRLSQNNGENGRAYPPYNAGARQVHIALMGDPTLRMHPVAPPSNLSADGSNGAKLNWSRSPDGSVLGYYVYRSGSPNGPFARVSGLMVTGTSFTDNPSAGNYTYMVRAIKLEQSASGTYYNPSQGIFATLNVQGSGDPGGGGGGGDTLSIPANLHVTYVSDSQINIGWNPVANATGYKIERKTGSGGTYAEVGNVNGNTVSFESNGLAQGTDYYFRVRAYNGSGFSGYSSETFTTTIVPGPVLPNVPNNLQATAPTRKQVALSWNDTSGNESGFKLERRTGANGTFTEVASLGANVTSYTDSGLNDDTEYGYRIRAFNGSGVSDYSNIASAHTPAGLPVQSTVALVTTDTATQGNWNAKYGTEAYVVASGARNVPSSLPITFSGATDFIWMDNTSDQRALISFPGGTARAASAWYSNDSMQIDVNVGSTATHRVALYFLDWDGKGRSQNVEIVDEPSGTVIYNQILSDFGQGKYMVWDVKGHVIFRLTKIAGPNALLSGLFIGQVIPANMNPMRLTQLGLNAGQFQLRVTGQQGQKFRIDVTSNFRDWSPLYSGALTADSFDYRDSSPKQTFRFYRAVTVP